MFTLFTVLKLYGRFSCSFVILARQEGLEPPTAGFGDRDSTIELLPQIAAFADNHIYIEKKSSEGRTATSLSVLDYNGRLQELVRMTAGATTSRAALESATELLMAADAVKASLKKK